MEARSGSPTCAMTGIVRATPGSCGAWRRAWRGSRCKGDARGFVVTPSLFGLLAGHADTLPDAPFLTYARGDEEGRRWSYADAVDSPVGARDLRSVGTLADGCYKKRTGLATRA